MVASILAVGFVAGGSVHLRVAPLLPPVTDADLDALIDEVYGKPGLGVEDSAGLFDVADEDTDEYEDDILDRLDWAKGGW